MDILDLEPFLNNSEKGIMNYNQCETSSNFDLYLTGDNSWDQYIQEPPSSENSCLESPNSLPDNNVERYFLEKSKCEEPGNGSGIINWSSRCTNNSRILSFGNPCSPMPAVRKKLEKSIPKRSRPDSAQREHVIAERKRREKVTEILIALSAIVPGLKKRDKASVLVKTIEYMKHLQEKVKTLEEHVVAKDRDDEGQSINKQPKLVSVSNTVEENPKIEIKSSGNTFLIKIHWFHASKRTLVKALNLIESLHLNVVSANSVLFSKQILDLTVTSKVEEGFEVTIKELLKRLKLGLEHE